ncbi:formyltetrahydrofolate hydrolase [[Clostridium] ultunense Esp]|uniref:formyltetrahydrofolate deformylase n=1 Tax=Thermicanus aegyptius TaxID=94009 RepID=UPI0002B6F0C6|nr:formyltetrahydrofolate deformylase [Thermicanus aegyptius]CCQ94877.1 formyltetrahydrofolate hydrolase [[Clostridium] ultunense Esp]
MSKVFNGKKERQGKLLISCPDRPGIVAAISRFLFEQGANILESNQYSTDPENGLFFMRILFDLPGLQDKKEALESAFAPVRERFGMTARFEYPAPRKKMAIFVSRHDHCLLELLWQWHSGDLDVEIPLVISNHPDLRAQVENMGIPYYHIPITSSTKEEAEEKELKLLEGKADFIVLARYMQILSPSFISHYPNRIINIHHSFLPAFVGGRPYEQAYERGVKLIGATAHYVTEELDQGPIIEQDVHRVTHNEGVSELKRIGRQVEKTVLARAVKWHIEDRIIVHQNKTIVFH